MGPDTRSPPNPDTATRSMEETHMTPEELARSLGYGHRPKVALPVRSAYRFGDTNIRMMEGNPILRRMRPGVMLAKKLGVRVRGLDVGALSRRPVETLYQKTVADARHPEGYPQAQGEQILLDQLAIYLRAMTGVEELDPESSLITRGGVDNIFVALLLTTEVGDTVTVFRPSWPNTISIIKMLGRKVYVINTDPAEDWRITPALLARIPRETKLIVAERPGNPTAMAWCQEELDAVATFMTHHDNRHMVFYADEEYFEVVSGDIPHSILELGLSRTISASAWSKNACATSLRLGRLTTLDRRLRQLWLPWANVILGATNWMSIQQSIAAMLNDFGPHGLPAYVHDLNSEMARKRGIITEEIGDIADSKLLLGNGAIYVSQVLTPADDATQMILWRMAEAIKAARNGTDDVPTLAYAIPLTGFQSSFEGYEDGPQRQMVQGFRITPQEDGDDLRQALVAFRQMVEGWRSAGRPQLGTIESVIGRLKANEPIEYKLTG